MRAAGEEAGAAELLLCFSLQKQSRTGESERREREGEGGRGLLGRERATVVVQLRWDLLWLLLIACCRLFEEEGVAAVVSLMFAAVDRRGKRSCCSLLVAVNVSIFAYHQAC